MLTSGSACDCNDKRSTVGYTARPVLVPYCLPDEAIYYPAPDQAAWRQPRQRRGYRRSRLARHQRYLTALRGCITPVSEEIRRRRACARSAAESAWIRHEEDARWYGHRHPCPHRPQLCDCHEDAYGEHHWWPFPEDEWEEEVVRAHLTAESWAEAQAEALARLEREMSSGRTF